MRRSCASAALDAAVHHRAQPRRHRRGGRLGSGLGGPAGTSRRGDDRRRAGIGVGAALPVHRDPRLLLLGALLMGFFGAGMWGVVPTYLSERFPTAVRSVGGGFAYHAGAALGSLTPYVVGALRGGWALADAMATCIAVSLVIVVAMLWLGPETRGRQFLALDVP